MSGGTWGYKEHELAELADAQMSPVYRCLLLAVARSEHIVDWAESGDTSRQTTGAAEGAERQLYDLWVQTFSEVYG